MHRLLLWWNEGRCNSGEGWKFITMQWVGNYVGEGISCIYWIKSRLISLHVLPRLDIWPSPLPPPCSKLCKYIYRPKQGCKQVSKVFSVSIIYQIDTKKFQKRYLLNTNRMEIRYQIRRKRKFYMVGVLVKINAKPALTKDWVYVSAELGNVSDGFIKEN